MSLNSLIDAENKGPVFIHSDLAKVFSLLPYNGSKEEILDRHIKFLLKELSEYDLWFPTFNYDFTKTKVFNLLSSPSQVGWLSEYFRQNYQEWRTECPVFSISGTGQYPIKNSKNIDIFGSGSFFEKLLHRKGTFLFYGASIQSATFIHYVEQISKMLIYRYKKEFQGKIVTGGTSKEVKVKFYVRPLNKYLDYDWNKIYEDLSNAKLIKIVQNKKEFMNVFSISVDALFEFWLKKMKENPFYFINEKSIAWIKPIYEEKKVNFLITDFE
jgi:aminoglycoside 3-N-acetyltransferase